ncbi:DUF3784 domain-containing protein [Alkaliphilus peptidifermentans]|uniref:PH domain-containing protein n=1 Tax=Alkaliphilus peptidifermentans DSM 18978 TaxID=1120976 RepID=A0A1G5BQ96_9FIRM|nr:DUF3784 domain-containing protein [Alkaliphilus peptidifermentans]SCX92204.1 protein of unknown function [Alkaliphilus peptidifermentans DSM 18978]
MVRLFVFLFTPMLLILFGILIKYFKQYWLIAGYNTASKKEKENIDAEKLGAFIGNVMFVLAAINLSGLLLRYLGYRLLGDLTWGLFIIVIIFTVFRGQSFYKESGSTNGKMDRLSLIVVLIVTLPILMFVGGLMWYGNVTNEVTVEGDIIRISGMYGTSVSREAITSIELLNEIPNIERKLNGLNFGNINKGVFRLADWGNGWVYLESNKGPYVVIRYNIEGLIVINYKNSEDTERVYAMISN